jgi:uncharacterized phosphatase
MKQLYVCRHGESELNQQERYAGQLDTPLTVHGRQQAEQAGQSAHGLGLRFDEVVASPLSRAHDTAKIIAQQIGYPEDKITIHPLFMERSYGSLSGQPWTVEADQQAYPDIETDAQLTARAEQALAYLRALQAETILLVCHGSFLVALRTLLDPQASTAELPNAKIVQFI